jgi:hypothetical protein
MFSFFMIAAVSGGLLFDTVQLIQGDEFFDQFPLA